MNFVQAFYSFDLELTDSDRDVFFKGRVKTMRFAEESLEHVYARLLAFIHSYEPGLELSKELENIKVPTIFKKNLLDEYDRWIEVGNLPAEKLMRALRKHGTTRHSVYWYSEKQVQTFSTAIQGHIIPGLQNVQFWKIAPEVIAALSSIDQRTTTWSITAVDQIYYLSVEGLDLQFSYQPVKISTRGYSNAEIEESAP